MNFLFIIIWSFGDAIANALSNEVNYFYDALNGGFAYKMNSHVIVPQSNTKPVVNLEAEMNKRQAQH